MTLSNTQPLTFFSQFFALSFSLCWLLSLIVFTCNLANKNCEVLTTGIIQINIVVKLTFTSFCVSHRDRTRASTHCCFCLFFSSFEHAKNLLIMGPNNTKNSSKSVIFSYLTMNNIVRIHYKKTPNLIKKLFLCFVSKPRVGPINSQHNNFKWGNISAGISMVSTHNISFMFIFSSSRPISNTETIDLDEIDAGTSTTCYTRSTWCQCYKTFFVRNLRIFVFS